MTGRDHATDGEAAAPGAAVLGAGPALADAAGVGATTMARFLDDVAARFGPNEALVFDDPLRHGATIRWSYADLHQEARRVAGALVADGTAPGARVAVLMGNRPEAVASVFGIAMAGAVPVLLSTFSTPAELAFMLDLSDAVVLLTQTQLLARRFVDEVTRFQVDIPDLGSIVAVGSSRWDAFLAAGATPDAAAEVDRRIDAVREDEEGLVIFSSGTTDAPKGIVHDQRSPTLQFWLQAGIFRRDQRTRMWAPLPLFWTAGLNTALGATLAAGGCCVLQETFVAGEALALLARERVTEPYSLPHQTQALAEHPDWPGTDLSSLRCVYGKSAFARHATVNGDPTWNMPVGYGMSETCAFFSAHDASTPRERLRASHGRLLPGNEVRVVDPDSRAPLGLDTDGELEIRGPTLLMRYLGSTPDACRTPDGFYRTGDVGRVDRVGDLHFSGRRSEMIKTGGANVSPAEVEVQLRACPAVKVARIVGLPDDRLDEIVVACITLADGADADADEIMAFLRERVAAYKVPRHVLFFDDGEIPMTTSGSKVRDLDLVALAAHRLADERRVPAPDPAPTSSGAS